MHGWRVGALLGAIAITLAGCANQSTEPRESNSPICGNGIIETNETCDDANTFPNDGCSIDCTIELNWSCDTSVTPTICEQSCFPDCSMRLCGTDGCGGLCGLCESEEVCSDDGQCVPADPECSPGCLTSQIGDGVCDPACFVETCDFDSQDGGETDCPTCGSRGLIADCAGTCLDPERIEWMNDAFCDDGTFGADLFCEEFAWDNGACGPAPGCEEVACTSPPPGRCENNEAITYAAAGLCSYGECSYEETRTPCVGTDLCYQARCYDALDPCVTDNIICTPPAPSCEDNAGSITAVTYAGDGFCLEGICDFSDVERVVECGWSDVCDQGECVTLPPFALCEGNILQAGDGICQPGNNTQACEWDGGDCCISTNAQCEELTTDIDLVLCTGTLDYIGNGTCNDNNNNLYCNFDGGDCCQDVDPTCSSSVGGCHCDPTEAAEFLATSTNICSCLDPEAPEQDPCWEVACINPSPTQCEGNQVAVYEATGTCNAGVCSYEAVPDAAVDCGESSTCTYVPALCDGEICGEAVCLPNSDTCAGISCLDTPDPFCDGNTAVSFDRVGSCSDGSCNYPITETPCETGTICHQGTCQTPAEAYPYCEPLAEARGIDWTTCNEFFLEFVGNGVCEGPNNFASCGFDGGDCMLGYPRNQVCDPILNTLACGFDGGDCCESTCKPGMRPAGLQACNVLRYDCQDPAAPEQAPCYHLACDTPPAAGCDGDQAVTYESEGTCSDAQCSYAELSRESCSEEEVCTLGQCLPATDSCAGVTCPWHEPTCDTNVLVETTAVRCVDGSCSPTTTREACGLGIWGYCEDGTCQTNGSDMHLTLVLDGASFESAFELTRDGTVIESRPFTSNDFFGVVEQDYQLLEGEHCLTWFDRFPRCGPQDDSDECNVDGQGMAGRITLEDDIVFEWDGSKASYPAMFGRTHYGSFCFTVVTHVEPQTEACTASGGELSLLRNQQCDLHNNTEACAYDGGDCCGATNPACLTSGDFPCSCEDPTTDNCINDCAPPPAACDGNATVVAEGPGVCTPGGCVFETTVTECGNTYQCTDGTCKFVGACGIELVRKGDGTCHPNANTEACTFDGGDCCVSTNPSCATSGAGPCDCLDPNAPEKDPCYQLECALPPRPTCDANDVVTYANMGRCSEGACLYEELSRTSCGEQVCSAGRCLVQGDPCVGISCKTPPESSCVDGTATTYAATGICADGSCTYLPDARLCALGCDGSTCGRGPSDVVLELETGTSNLATSASDIIWSLQDEQGTMLGSNISLAESTLYQELFSLTEGRYCIHITNFVGGGGLGGVLFVDAVLVAEWGPTDFEDTLQVCFEAPGVEPPPLDRACPEDTFADCANRCADNVYLSWQGDGFCDDGRYYLDLSCEAFAQDGGDCL